MRKRIPRIIPCLLYENEGLVKTVKFDNSTYIGDPINAVKIYNEMEADELIFLDIEASKKGRIDYSIIQEIANEAFMPVCYGGGVSNIEQIQQIINIGIEKVALNTSIVNSKELIKEAANQYGSQSIIACINIKRDSKGVYFVYNSSTSKILTIDLVEHIKEIQEAGAGEILINDVDRDGTMEGYDIELLKKVRKLTKLPVIACGGASSLINMKTAITEKVADAVAAGSIFVYFGSLNGILINYPRRSYIKSIF